MVSYVAVEGYRDYAKFVENVESDYPPTYFYFYGTRMSNGVSWCSDCAYVEPIIRSYLRKLREYVIIVFVGVGYRDNWKNMSGPFRNDNELKLRVIPTLIKHGSSQRLEGSQCTSREFLDMIFDRETLEGDKVRENSSNGEINRSRKSYRQNNDPEIPPRRRSRSRVSSVEDYNDPSENRQEQDPHHSRKRDPRDSTYKNNKEDSQHTRLPRRPDSQQNPEPQQSITHQDNYSRYRQRQNNDPETPPRRRSRNRVGSVEDYNDPSKNRQEPDPHHSRQRDARDSTYKNNMKNSQHTRHSRRSDSR